MSSAENNKAVVRRFIEEFYNRGNMDVADELLAPDFVSRDALLTPQGGAHTGGLEDLPTLPAS